MEREGEGDLTPQVGTAIRAEVQFFAPISEAVVVCAVASAVLERRKFVGKNFMMKNQVQFVSNTTLSLERQNWIWKRRGPELHNGRRLL